MKKISKTISILCAMFILITGNSITATAAPPLNNEQIVIINENQIYTLEDALATIDFVEEIHNAENGLIENDISDLVLQSINLSGDGIDDITYSLKSLGEVVEDGEGSGILYSLTAVSSVKNTGNTHKEDNVHCYINVVWKDNFGPDNELISVQGGWETERTLYNRTVYYGVDDNTVTDTPTSNSYYYDNLGMIGCQIHAVATVQSQGYNPIIMVAVTPTILD